MQELRGNRGAHHGKMQHATIGPRAFTLIELLVVVAIISLLISMLLPSLSRARAVARMVKCQAILKQFGTAHHMYASESDDWFVPVWVQGFGNWPQWSHWRELVGMRPGGNFVDGLVCPDVPPDGRFGHMYFNYGMNATAGASPHPFYMHQEHNMRWHSGDRDPSGTTTGTGIALRTNRNKVRNPTGKVQNLDASWVHALMGPADWRIRWDLFPEVNAGFPQFGTGGVASQTSYRHFEGANLLMFDGHVEHRPKNDVFSYNPNNSVNTTKNQDLWYMYK